MAGKTIKRKYINILGKRYTVIYKHLRDNAGLCLAAKNQIYIDTNGSKQDQEEALLHECIHAIISEFAIRIEDEEDLVNPLSIGLYAVLKTNKMKF